MAHSTCLLRGCVQSRLFSIQKRTLVRKNMSKFHSKTLSRFQSSDSAVLRELSSGSSLCTSPAPPRSAAKERWKSIGAATCGAGKRERWLCSSSSHLHQFDEQHVNPNTTLDREELEKFRILSQQFWKENGDFQALHRLNELRVPLIRDTLLKQRAEGRHSNTKPLHGATIVDVGCGGGILSEPLARLGATVIGIDATPENIEVAQHHLSHDPTIRGNIKYICGTAQDLIGTESEKFDAVVASEVIEHVTMKDDFIQTCADLVKPGGSLFFTTINKTWLSYACGIFLAERVLSLVPDGTHDWNKFVSPAAVGQSLEDNNCEVKLTHGMLYNPITKRWSWTGDTSINYALVGRKLERPHEEDMAGV